ncbi:MAG TPA: tyrosine-type recombinase/integrase, partial [Polyangiaceae bacterium]
RAPKGRRIRRVELFGHAARAIEHWREITESWCPRARNQHQVVFPGQRGGLLASDHLPYRRWYSLAGVSHPVTGGRPTWHSLRHTCAASLVSGLWGEPWRLEEVRVHLGHRSIEETERYAHLSPEALQARAARTSAEVCQRVGKMGSQVLEIIHAGVDDGN